MRTPKHILKRLFLLLTLMIFSQGWALAEGVVVDSRRYYLSGRGGDDSVEWDFFCSKGEKSDSVKKIAVPSCWEQQGFGLYNYGLDSMSVRSNEYGIYKHKFTIAKEWRGQMIKIFFEGVMTDAQVKINGKLVGDTHQGGFYPFEYRVDHLLKYGAENTIEVKVHKESSNVAINKIERSGDFWIFGGIYKPVYLEVTPKDFIDHIAVDAKDTGAVNIDIFTTSRRVQEVVVELEDLNGKSISKFKTVESKLFSDKWRLKCEASGIKRWDPEHPHLYNLIVKIMGSDGTPLHRMVQRIGFRSVEVLKGDGVYINGERVKFKGVNISAFHHHTGRTISNEWCRAQVEMVKNMNMNAVLVSHNPPGEYFLDLCDSLGLFVVSDLCTWHTSKVNTKVWRDVVRQSVEGAINHPSVVMWLNSDESGWNNDMRENVAIWDIQKREVVHSWDALGKINVVSDPQCNMGLMNDSRSLDKILFHTTLSCKEYLKDSGYGLDEYWSKQWNMPLSAGGFLSALSDEVLDRADKGGEEDWRGARGIVDASLTKNSSYRVVKEIWSPIYIEDRIIRDDFTGLFRVENRFHYTSLYECKMESKWVKFILPDSVAVIHQSDVSLPNLSAGAKGSFRIDKPEGWELTDALYLTAYDNYGREIFTWSYPVRLPAQVNADIVDYEGEGEVTSIISGDSITVRGGNIEYIFDRVNGGLLSVKRDSTTVIPLRGGERILDPKRHEEDKIDTLVIGERNGAKEILFVAEKSYKYEGMPQAAINTSDTIRWRIHPNGLLDMRVTQRGNNSEDGYKGVTFSFLEDSISGVKWLGDGAHRVWRSGKNGTKFNLWQRDYNGVEAEYPEFKGFYSSLYWADICCRDSSGFKVYSHTPNIYVRLFTPSAFPAALFPEGDISFVVNLPEVGTSQRLHNFTNDYEEPIVIEMTFDFR